MTASRSVRLTTHIHLLATEWCMANETINI